MPALRGGPARSRPVVPRLRPIAQQFPTPPEYRADGWPLCPRCGKDWLRSVRVNETLKGVRLHEAQQSVQNEYVERHGRALLTDPALYQRMVSEMVEAKRRRPRATDEMRCTACGWNGGVCARAEHHAGPASRRGQ